MGDPLFPPCAPCLVRQLSVGDGHVLHIEECGPTDGLPVVFLHDGPGIGCRPEHRRLFDPARFRAILIDQRGAGQSRPLGEQQANTTPDLVADLEYVREALGLAEWVVFGNGWGSLLALAYAQLFPERIAGLLLCGVFLGWRGDAEENLRRASAALSGAASTDTSLRWTLTGAALERLERDLHDPDPARAQRAAQAWLAQASATPGECDAARRLADARLQVHYLRRKYFVAESSLLAGVPLIRHLPGVIMQSLEDTSCPPMAAEALHRAWPEAIWMPLPGSSHDLHTPAVARAAIKALNWVVDAVAVA